MDYFKNGSKMWRWLLVFVWMFLIYLFSAQPANTSNNISLGLIDKVFSIFGFSIHTDLALLNIMNFVIRKAAHLFIYLILGGLITNALWPYRLTKGSLVLLSITIGSSYAAIDEFHQLFVAGRSGQISDVLLDSCGVLIGVILVSSLLFHKSALIKHDQ